MSSRRRAPTPGEDGENQGAQESDAAAPSGDQTGPEGAAPAQSPTWTVRRTEVEWAQSMHKAMIDYQAQLSASNAAYYGALAAVVSEAYARELSALADAAAGDEAGPPDRQAGTMAALRKWHSAVEVSRQEAFRAVAEAQARLAEESHRAWLELLGKQQEANLQYGRAVEEVYAAAPTDTGSAFRVIGDEGPAVAAGMPWAFNVVGDEGVTNATASTTGTWPMWAGWPAA